MILTCPECSARYVVDPMALMPSGRVVRCAKCKHSWKEDAPDEDDSFLDNVVEEIPEEDVPTPEPSDTDQKETDTDNQDIAEDEFAIKRARRKKRPRPLPKGSNLPALQNHNHGSILWGWYGLGAFVVTFIACFLIFQSTISEFWTPSKKLYAALGMEHQNKLVEKNEVLFKIEDTKVTVGRNGTQKTLIVEGNIANLSDRTLSPPLLRILIKDNKGATIREWTYDAYKNKTVSKGEKIPFSTSLPNPPENADIINIVFANNKPLPH